MNKITNHYFKNMFIRKKKTILLYTFVCFIGYPFLMITDLITNYGSSNAAISKNMYLISMFVLGLLAIILPIFTFKFTLNKKNVDLYYSIPINRNHLFKSHFIAPILGACIPILLNYLIGGILLFNFELYIEYLLCLFLSFVIFAILYSINSFFVLKCNNVLDASIISITVTLLPFVVVGALSTFLYSQVANSMIEIGEYTTFAVKVLTPIMGFVQLSAITRYHNFVSFRELEWAYLIYYVLIGCAFAYLAYKEFKVKKGENAEQLTKSFITYPFLTNIGFIALMLIFNLINNNLTANIFIVIALFVIFVIVNGIANRSMKVTLSMVLRFVALIVIINGFNYISRETEFFGINRQVLDYTKYDQVLFDLNNYYGNESYDDYNIVIDSSKVDDEEKELFEYIKNLQERVSYEHKVNKWGNAVYDSEKTGYLSINYQKSDKTINYVHYELEYDEEIKIKEMIDEIVAKRNEEAMNQR